MHTASESDDRTQLPNCMTLTKVGKGWFRSFAISARVFISCTAKIFYNSSINWHNYHKWG